MLATGKVLKPCQAEVLDSGLQLFLSGFDLKVLWVEMMAALETL